MQPVATLVPPSPVTYCRLARDGSRLFITRTAEDKSFTAEVWDVPAQKLLFALPRQSGPGAACLAEASPDMRLVATNPCEQEYSTTFTLWDVASGDRLRSWSTGHEPIHSTYDPRWYGVNYYVFSADGSRLVTAGIDGTTRVWDTATNRVEFILRGHSSEVVAAEFSPDGQRLATAGWDNTARIWDLTPGASAGKEIVHIKQDNAVEAIAFSPDGAELATGTVAGAIELWDALDGGRLLSLKGNPGGILYLVFSPDGTRLFSLAEDLYTRL
jgi:WD40 repeat protein